MTDEKNCPKCRTPLPADSSPGVCPQCLMEAGLTTTVGPVAPRAELPEPGATFGPYRIGEKLGSGGMGAVYLAEHIETGRRLALKVLNHRLESPQHRQRFLREGRLAASISHPNSVYIYGTDEIGGTPVIAMELAGGGTLQDRVKRDGPLPVGEAVDVILQIIDGLEAAESAGVLHRDVKPANCFLDADGTVKIGDFGLSISTAPRAETDLTESGVFLGTPAFSSPEQLRGDELDVRSDIYSVGVTLFYLLTGRTPFEAQQMVQLLATVLEQPAPSPAQFRSEVPIGLAKVVQRCLAKRRTQRFKGYDGSRRALLPYASAAPSPATLGFRVLAFGLDVLVLCVLAALLPILWVRDVSTWHDHLDAILSTEPSRQPLLMLLAVLGILMQGGYFAIFEGLWGTTVGKSVCRLRVIDSRREPPGLWRSVLRTSVYYLPYLLPFWIHFAIDAVRHTDTYDEMNLWLLGGALAAQYSLFVTVRRGNGYAAIYELASGTRVVGTRLHQHRPALPMADESLPQATSKQSWGPYQVLGPLESGPSPMVTLGYDTRLLRKVWIRPCPADAPPVPQHLRELSRIGRLRWLNGQRSAEGGWDAYEAPSGKPLLEVIGQKQSWNVVRFWLLDLAQELSAGQADDSLPEVLDLDRVWITADGRAKLLDFRAPNVSATSGDGEISAPPHGGKSMVAVFLKRVAIAALEGDLVPASQVNPRDLSLPMPVSARAVLNDLGRSQELELPTAELNSFTHQAASVSKAKRAGVLAACWLVPLAFTVLVAVFLYSERQFLQAHPAAGELAGYIDYYRSLGPQDERRTAVEIIVAHEYRDTVSNPQVWSQPGMDGFVDADGRRLLEGFLEAHPIPTEEQVAAARNQLAPFRWEIRAHTWSADDIFYAMPLNLFLVSATLSMLVLFVIIPGTLSVAFTGNSLLLRSLDIVLVTKNGAPASRVRVLWRNAVLWSLVLVALVLLLTVAAAGRVRPSAVLLVGLIVWMFLAERGLHDRLAGTWLVPR
jgi:eukaryotic-like serine/threonine-protein kinase